MKLSEKGWSKAEKYLCPECWKDTNWERPNEPEFEPEDFKDFEKELSKFFFKLMEEQRPLPADMARLLNEHFWELG